MLIHSVTFQKVDTDTAYGRCPGLLYYFMCRDGNQIE